MRLSYTRGLDLSDILALLGCLLGLIAALGLMGCGRPTSATSQRCLDNLRRLDTCKGNWALENRKDQRAVPTWNDLRPFFPEWWSNQIPVCPDGGTYVLRSVGEPPRCSIGGSKHSLP